MKKVFFIIMVLGFARSHAQDNAALLEVFGRQIYECIRDVDSLKAVQFVAPKEIADRYVDQTSATAEDKVKFSKKTETQQPKILREMPNQILKAHLAGVEEGIDWKTTKYVSTVIETQPTPANEKIEAIKISVNFLAGKPEFAIRAYCIVVDGVVYLVSKPRLVTE